MRIKKKILDEEYTELLISELVSAAMEDDHISERKLAVMACVSPAIIQGVRLESKLILLSARCFEF